MNAAGAFCWFPSQLAYDLIGPDCLRCIETLMDERAVSDPDIQAYRQRWDGQLEYFFVKNLENVQGDWRDNVFVERLWRSGKYEEVYLRAYDSVSEARASIGRYLDFYSGRRPHSSLDDATPDQAYFNPLPIRMAA